MQDGAEYGEFQELINDIIKTEIQKFLKNEYIFRGVTGKITKVNGDNTYSVDIVTTILNNIPNKSGTSVSLGDSVTLLDRYGSNYSNCFIFIKNGYQDSEPTKEEVTKQTEDVAKKILEDYFNDEEYLDWKNNIDINIKKVSSFSEYEATQLGIVSSMGVKLLAKRG